MAAFQGGFLYANGQAHATDAATNTEECPVGPSPCSSSSSLASLLLSHEGGRAGSIGGGGGSSMAGSIGCGGSSMAGSIGGGKTRTAPEEVPTSEIDALMAQRKQQEQEAAQHGRAHAAGPLRSAPSSSSLIKQDGGKNKVLEGEEEGEAVINPAPLPSHRRNPDWLRDFHLASIGAEITPEEAAILRSLAFGMGAGIEVEEEEEGSIQL